MASQSQGKGKKKNKETKVSLEEFNQIEAPIGHSVVSLKSLDWAATMADYDQQAAATQQIIVPTAPRAQRGPDIDYDSLPNDPPFKASLFNLPLFEEKELRDRFFQGLGVVDIEVGRTTTSVEFSTKQDLYEALSKDGTSIKGRTVNVCLFGQSPQSNYQDRYGGRGGNSSYNDRYGDRAQGGGFGGSRIGDRYGDRYGDGFNRNRDSSGFGRGGVGEGRYQDRSTDRFNQRGNYTSGGGEPEEPENWRAAARPPVKPPQPTGPTNDNGAKQPYIDSRQDSSYNIQYSDRTPGGGFGGPRVSDRYGDRPGAGYNRGRDSSSSFNRSGSGGFSQQRSGYDGRYQYRGNDRYNHRGNYTSGGGESEEPENWRAAARPPIKPTPPSGPA